MVRNPIEKVQTFAKNYGPRSMILSILSISSRDFAFGFPKRPHTIEIVFLTYKLMIFLLIRECETTTLNNPQQSFP